MTDLIHAGGTLWTVPALVLGVSVIALAGLSFARLRDVPAEETRRRASIVTHLGLLAFVWGILGQGIGLYQAMTAIEAAGDISPAIVAGGLKVSSIAPLMGLSVFALALVARVALGALAEAESGTGE